MKTKLAAGLALVLAVSLAPLAFAACGSQTSEEGGESRSAGRAAAEPAGDASNPVAVSDPAGGALLPVGPRVIQTASLRLRLREGGFESAVERARTIAAGFGGFVIGSSAAQGRGDRLVEGTLVVRVPARRYPDAMSSFARLGRIEAREESGQDVSQEFVDLEARTRHLEAVETQLLALLRRAGTVASALAVQSRLNEVQLQLEQVRGRARFLEDQVAFATISLDLAERRPDGDDGTGWQVVDAWRDGAEAFVFVAGRIFVVLATVAPLVLLLAVALLAARFARRRRLLRA
ncbi:MAG TPA: DUF4349 domain-containing protein [Gaiellaceae bacterium]|nr:DUF4349 domain-containing protein [Gaiellaceae bacterium]